MVAFLLAIYFIVCVILIGAILIQANKGTSIAGIFGGGSDTFLGASNATSWINKATTYLAVVFLLLSFVLTLSPIVTRTGPGPNVPDASVPDESPASAPAGAPAGAPADGSEGGAAPAAPAQPVAPAPQ